jgi:hypothetical protein
MTATVAATAKLYSTRAVEWKNAMKAPVVANAMHPVSAPCGFGNARHASATDALVAIAKASDCQREGQRHAHSTALTTPVASAVHIIATAHAALRAIGDCAATRTGTARTTLR